ncbi:twin-arginine translocase TatA/TatE family subunit [Archangium lansingense]|uniref:Sec-independent protein translocase protein TatA n=1 Tax=Archangium lansingense TaxID=2995310 RepID=A0ABT4A7L3_9BACT|nr:twin-arginine translocase TatA/TatE family subunit [Archangium lansinium]MCY1076942.1 twin-arginine translocase TatA/TatE family subunit [Archangium lansinium]
MEILLIMAVLLLLFGASRLPQLGSALGSSIRNFKRSFSSDDAPATDDKKQPGPLASSTTVEKDATARSTSHQG